jgi:hypothetical protein
VVATETAAAEDLGVFRANHARPIHRWYPFVEGYSEALVVEALGTCDPWELPVFDPFGGSGTTALAAARHGRDSVFSEVNPYLAWVADVKVNCAREAAKECDVTRVLTELADKVASGYRWAVPKQNPLLDADDRRGFFPAGTARELLGLLESISDTLSGVTRELAKLACTTALIPCSNMIRRTDLRRRVAGDPPPMDWRSAVEGRLRMIAEDLVLDGANIQGSTQVIGTDIREVDGGFRTGLIVTSPPYLNGTNYVRNTKLELLALRLVREEGSLTEVRDRAITAGINNVSSRRAVSTIFPSVEVVAQALDVAAYDVRIPALVRGYFSDMSTALHKMRTCAVPGAHMYLDIGNSRFAGVDIPTHDLLAELGEAAGWQLIYTRALRERRSYDGTRLVQVLLHFVAA